MLKLCFDFVKFVLLTNITLTEIAMCDNKKPSTVYLPPLTNFTFGSKEPQYEKDPSVSAR